MLLLIWEPMDIKAAIRVTDMKAAMIAYSTIVEAELVSKKEFQQSHIQLRPQST